MKLATATDLLNEKPSGCRINTGFQVRAGACALLVACLVTGLSGCGAGATPTAGPASSSPLPTNSNFTITSPEFASGKPVPRKYTCDGGDSSPPLRWGEPPAGTRSLALIVDDPDAPGGTWVHWVLYNLPVTTRSLPEAVAQDPNGPDGSRQGRNSFGRSGYGGPCPPGGSTHHYFFRLYALDTEANPPAEATADQLQSAMDKHILAYAELVGTYSK
jgi:Raf kinase inhibitor-like YbhB/YbcL family protein